MLDGKGDDDDNEHHGDHTHSDDQGGDHHYPSLIMTSLWGGCRGQPRDAGWQR